MVFLRVLHTIRKVLISVLLLAGWLLAASKVEFEPLPVPVANSAVASLKVRGQTLFFSMMGIGEKKTWDAVTNDSYALDVDTGKWTKTRPVPGSVGRLGSAAVAARDHVFLFGGYVVDSRGGIMTVPDVNVYDPLTDRWFRGQDTPVRVQDAVIGVYHDRYIYLIGGRSGNQVLRDVQVYDAEKNIWKAGTPLAGPPVFGHAGAVVDDNIVYIDGATANSGNPAFVVSNQCWRGKIDHHDPEKIQWTKLPEHPGSGRFHIAAAGSDKDDRIYFAGGSDKPFSHTGMGYDGKAAEPSPEIFDFNLKSGKWETISDNQADATMDNRGLLISSRGLVRIGGLDKDQKVTARVTVLPKQSEAAKKQ